MRDEKRKMLPVGIESFDTIRTENFYYIDKTGLIRELLENWGMVNLFTRPRRFGKSLNMSMLKTFFEIGCKRELFEGLEIRKEAELCEKYMGQFPVIALSLKGVIRKGLCHGPRHDGFRDWGGGYAVSVFKGKRGVDGLGEKQV